MPTFGLAHIRRLVDEARWQVLRRQAQLCAALGEPSRLALIALLGGEERAVGELVAASALPQATVSRHLAVLRQHGEVSARRAGTTMRYALTDPAILEVCALVRGILARQLAAEAALARRVPGTGL